MRDEQLVGRPRRRYRVTTTHDPAAAPAPNHLDQRFTVTRRNDVWAADLTSLPTRQGWVYLAVVLDLYSRRIVGWALEATLDPTRAHGLAARRSPARHRAAAASF
jgi:putative transposase